MGRPTVCLPSEWASPLIWRVPGAARSVRNRLLTSFACVCVCVCVCLSFLVRLCVYAAYETGESCLCEHASVDAQEVVCVCVCVCVCCMCVCALLLCVCRSVPCVCIHVCVCIRLYQNILSLFMFSVFINRHGWLLPDNVKLAKSFILLSAD